MMLIKITNYWSLNSYDWIRDYNKFGLKLIKSSFGKTFKVIDKQLFFLCVIEHGIAFRKICDVPPYETINYGI